MTDFGYVDPFGKIFIQAGKLGDISEFGEYWGNSS
jgi:hypothetical protein